MTEDRQVPTLRHCIFCWMRTAERFLRVPMCPICRDQSYDFLLVSGVQMLMVPFVAISGFQFTVQEALFFVVLIFVKHRITPPWQRSR